MHVCFDGLTLKLTDQMTRKDNEVESHKCQNAFHAYGQLPPALVKPQFSYSVGSPIS